MSNYFKKIDVYWSLSGTLHRKRLMGRTRLFVLLLSVPLLKKIFGRKPRKLVVAFMGKDFDFFVRDSADIAVLEEIFIDKEYDFDSILMIKEALDMGAHVGAVAIFIKINYPNAHITCIEPDRENFELLMRNTAQFEGIECVHAAIAPHAGKIRFNTYSRSSISGSIMDKRASDRYHEVDALSLDDVIAQSTRPVDLLKFDIEGAEYDVFSTAASLTSVGAFIGELHLDLIPGRTKDDFCSIFKGFDVSAARVNDRRYIIRAIRR